MPRKTAIIIGAVAAGLTDSSELLDRTDIVPTVIELKNDSNGRLVDRTVPLHVNAEEG
jgi:hypothetical protein